MSSFVVGARGRKQTDPFQWDQGAAQFIAVPSSKDYGASDVRIYNPADSFTDFAPAGPVMSQEWMDKIVRAAGFKNINSGGKFILARYRDFQNHELVAELKKCYAAHKASTFGLEAHRKWFELNHEAIMNRRPSDKRNEQRTASRALAKARYEDIRENMEEGRRMYKDRVAVIPPAAMKIATAIGRRLSDILSEQLGATYTLIVENKNPTGVGNVISQKAAQRSKPKAISVLYMCSPQLLATNTATFKDAVQATANKFKISVGAVPYLSLREGKLILNYAIKELADAKAMSVVERTAWGKFLIMRGMITDATVIGAINSKIETGMSEKPREQTENLINLFSGLVDQRRLAISSDGSVARIVLDFITGSPTI